VSCVVELKVLLRVGWGLDDLPAALLSPFSAPILFGEITAHWKCPYGHSNSHSLQFVEVKNFAGFGNPDSHEDADPAIRELGQLSRLISGTCFEFTSVERSIPFEEAAITRIGRLLSFWFQSGRSGCNRYPR